MQRETDREQREENKGGEGCREREMKIVSVRQTDREQRQEYKVEKRMKRIVRERR